MNGCLIKNTPIAVDLWVRDHLRDANFFFLTHLHEDHIKGLTSSWRFPIYTSPINKILLDKKFSFSHDLVIPLELDEPHIIPLNTKHPSSMSVTLIDANHVPGAVMFLFQGYFGTILYSGDMRFEPYMLKHPSIEESLRSSGIDELYLDNTFCCPSYNFPSREFAAQQVFKIIEDHPNHCIKLGIRKLGKEDLMEKIAVKFKERILVSEEKYGQLKLMGRLDVYTTNPNESRIEALIIQRIHARNHLKWNEYKPTVCIKLTAIYYGIKDNVCGNKFKTMITVPYSDHSSWSELHEFVKGLKPGRIIPIVKRNIKKMDFISKALSSTYDMSVFQSYLSPPHTNISTDVPEFIGKKFHEMRPKFGSGESKKKNIIKKRKVSNRGVFYEPFDDTPEDGQLKDIANEIISADLDSNASIKSSDFNPLGNEEGRDNEACQNQLLSTNSFDIINDSSTFNCCCNERKSAAGESNCTDLTDTFHITNKGDNLEEELDGTGETSQNFKTFVDGCSKDLSQICELIKSRSEHFDHFKVDEHPSLTAITNRLLSFVDNSINFEKGPSKIVGKSSDEIQTPDVNFRRVDSFEGFKFNETNPSKEIKKKLFCFIDDCVRNSIVYSQTTEEDISDLNDTSELNITHCNKFKGFDSKEQSFKVIRKKLLCFVEDCRRSPNLENSLNEDCCLSEANYSRRIAVTKEVSGTNKRGCYNIQKLSSKLEQNCSRVSDKFNDLKAPDKQQLANNVSLEEGLGMSTGSFVNPIPKKSSFFPSDLPNPENYMKTNINFSGFKVNELQTISTPHKKLMVSTANSFSPILSSISISDDITSFSTNICDETFSSTSISDENLSSSTSASCGEFVNKHDSDASANFENFTTDKFFRQNMFHKANSQLDSVLMELKEGGIPIRKLNSLCNTVEQYINTF